MRHIILKKGVSHPSARNVEKEGEVSLTRVVKNILTEMGVAFVDPCCDIVGDAPAAFFPQGAQNDIPAGQGGAIPVTNYFTTINTDAGGDAFTLANAPVLGQMKKILLATTAGGNAVITPANLFAGTTITLNTANEYVILQWNGIDWIVVENVGAVIA